MPPSRHLSEARRLSQDVSGFGEAKRHLGAIEPKHKEYAQAEAIWKTIVKKEQAIAKKQEAERTLAGIRSRELAAGLMERRFLNKGMDVYVSLAGKDKTTLRIKYVLVSRPLAHQLANDGATLDSLRKVGFKKLILEDGYNESWSIDF
jgi:hypothetical protein